LQLPYEVADMDEMTIAMWVNWRSSSTSWSRIFDFGNGTDHYMFLTPNNGSVMRFAIKNGGDEQQVEAITASTITSRAFLTAVNNAYNAYKSQSVDGVSGATSNAENKKD
jgi:hypothetical protein